MPDFPYINARVRAMRSRLLDAGQTEELLGAPTLEAFLQRLATTPYGLDLQTALTRSRGIEAVDEALGRNFAAATQKILSFADGRPRALIEVLLLRWDLANVRAVLRGKHTERSEEQIMDSVLPAGLLSEVALRELARQPGIPGVAGALEALGHPLGPAVAQGLAAYVEGRDLLALELSLDRFYAEYVLTTVRGGGHDEVVLQELLAAEIDVLNVKIAVKLARHGETLSTSARRPFFLPGGSIVREDLFLALSRPETAERAWQALRAHGFPAETIPESLTEFEKTVDLMFNRWTTRLYLGDPLGIDIVVGYLTLKYNEVVNLRLIARSKSLGIPRDLVRKEMVRV